MGRESERERERENEGGRKNMTKRDLVLVTYFLHLLSRPGVWGDDKSGKRERERERERER